jgi:hypothetical protein
MTDFRDTLRAELVAAAARPLPRRRLLPERPVLIRGGLIAAAAAAAVLAIFVLPWSAEKTPQPAQRTTPLVGQPLFGGSLDEGVRYATRALRPQISLRANDGRWWVYDAQSDTTLVLQRREGNPGAGTERAPLRFLMFFRLPSVFDPTKGDISQAPRDIVAWMRTNPNLGITDVSRTTLYGKPATRLTFHIPKRPTRTDPTCEFAKVTVDTEIPRVATCAAIGPSVTAPVDSAGYFIVPEGDDPLIVGELALVPSQLGQIARESAPILDSVQIGR